MDIAAIPNDTGIMHQHFHVIPERAAPMDLVIDHALNHGPVRVNQLALVIEHL